MCAAQMMMTQAEAINPGPLAQENGKGKSTQSRRDRHRRRQTKMWAARLAHNIHIRVLICAPYMCVCVQSEFSINVTSLLGTRIKCAISRRVLE